MADDGDRLLNYVGVLLVVGIAAALVVLFLSATSAPARQAEPPETDWAFERVNGSHARIVHSGGEPVSAERLVVLANRYERPVTWEGRLTRGDGGVVRVGPGQSVRLYWDGGRADRQLLAGWNTDTDTPA
jgi:hypothetical protein